MVNKKPPIDYLPNRLKFYLLDWKDMNIHWFSTEFKTRKLSDLNINQLDKLYKKATLGDLTLITNLKNKLT